MTDNATPATPSTAPLLNSQQAAILAAHLVDAKKAEGIKILDVRNICGFTDFFLLLSAPSGTQLRALSGLLRDGLKSVGHRAQSEDYMPNTSWMVVDAGDVVAHLFLPEARQFYNLERLWGDGPEVEWQAGPDAERAKAMLPRILAGGSTEEIFRSLAGEAGR